MFTSLQKVSALIISLICVFTSFIGVLERKNYNTVTADSSAFDSAGLINNKDNIQAENDFCENIDTKYIDDQLQEADTVFVITVKDMKNQYECLKHTVKVDRVIKGENIKNGDTAVFYEYSHFILDDNSNLKYLQTITQNMPLRKNKKYLVFAESIDYEKGYQNTLPCREFRIFDAEIDTFCLTDYQSEPLSGNAKYFKDIKNSEYVCYNKKSLNNLNKIKKNIINKYMK